MSPPIYTTDEIELDGMEWPTVSLEEAWNRSKPYSAYVDCANHWVLQARFATEAEALD